MACFAWPVLPRLVFHVWNQLFRGRSPSGYFLGVSWNVEVLFVTYPNVIPFSPTLFVLHYPFQTHSLSYVNFLKKYSGVWNMKFWFVGWPQIRMYGLLMMFLLSSKDKVFYFICVYKMLFIYHTLFTIFVVARLTPLREQHKILTHNRPLSLDKHSGSINTLPSGHAEMRDCSPMRCWRVTHFCIFLHDILHMPL